MRIMMPFGRYACKVQSHITANCGQTISSIMAPGEYKRAISSFAKLLR